MISYTPNQIKEKYSKVASKYDILESVPELLGLARLRHDLFQKAEGNVLEVAAGTGKNFSSYKKSIKLTAVDYSPDMLVMAQKKATKHRLSVHFKIMDAHALDFHNNSFDTVTSSLSMCTFTNPVKVLNEMMRVCKPGGRILLLEHGRSSKRWINRWLDRKEAAHAETLGCHWNRNIDRILVEAGITKLVHKYYFFGIIHSIEAVR